jgi:hypothetical protein
VGAVTTNLQLIEIESSLSICIYLVEESVEKANNSVEAATFIIICLFQELALIPSI